MWKIREQAYFFFFFGGIEDGGVGLDVRGSWKLVWAKLLNSWTYQAWLAKAFRRYEVKAAKDLL